MGGDQVRQTIGGMLAGARDRLDRVHPEDFDAEVAAGAVVIDVRDSALRATQGPLDGALEIDLTILEWRVAPSSKNRIIDVQPGQRVILVCNEGYSSSLAAARLLDLGVDGATDLIGGVTALWEHRASMAGRSNDGSVPYPSTSE